MTKRQMIERLLKCWEAKPYQRLGQLIENARTIGLIHGDGAVDLFQMGDAELIETVERFVGVGK